MSHTRVKTTYSEEDTYACTKTKTLYCHHNHSCDHTTFYNEDGSITEMSFGALETGNDLWDAMERLWFPFKNEWNGELKDDVEYYYEEPWNTEK
jgi:hypothetical protein